MTFKLRGGKELIAFAFIFLFFMNCTIAGSEFSNSSKDMIYYDLNDSSGSNIISKSNASENTTLDLIVEYGNSIIKVLALPFSIYLNIAKIVLALISLPFLYEFIQWIRRKEESIIVYPFDTKCQDFDGRAISDLLISEFNRIKITSSSRQHGHAKNSNDEITSIESDYKSHMSGFHFPEFSRDDDSEFIKHLSALGNINLGPISLSLGQVVLMIKALSSNNRSRIIKGSVQNYNSDLTIIIHLSDGFTKTRTWTWKEEKASLKQEEFDKQIPIMIRKLSYKIFRKLILEE